MNIFKETLFDQVTRTQIVIDERVFDDCQKFQLQEIKKRAAELILEVAPEHKQRNAALGLLSDTETQELKTNIQNLRNISNTLEAQILAITWDGTEQNRAAACDAVQNIRWP